MGSSWVFPSPEQPDCMMHGVWVPRAPEVLHENLGRCSRDPSDGSDHPGFRNAYLVLRYRYVVRDTKVVPRYAVMRSHYFTIILFHAT